MKKQLLMTSVLAAVAAFAPPALAATTNSTQSGLYVGGFGAYDWNQLEAGAFDTDVDGWEGGVLLGYKLDVLMDRMNGFGVGMTGAVEGFYAWSDAEETSFGVTTEKENEWGVSFRPGFSFITNATQSLGINPYGILGYRNTKFEAAAGPFSGSERYDGFELGIGTELVTFGNFGVRLEYSHTWYASENGVDPSADSLRMGVTYHF